MRAYLGFKGMSIEKGILYSPSVRVAWDVVNIDDRPHWHHKAVDGSLGIHAATATEASHYSQDMFLVAPYSPVVDDDGNEVVDVTIASRGWRAGEAIILDGPVKGREQAIQRWAPVIMQAYWAGYPQCPGILLEAAVELGNFNFIAEHPELVNDYQGFLAVLEKFGRLTPAMVDKLVGLKDVRIALYAALHLADQDYDSRIMDVVVHCSESAEMLMALRYLPDNRYDKGLMNVFLTEGEYEDIVTAAIFLPDDRYNPQLVDVLVESRESEFIARAAVELPDRRYDERLIEALLECGVEEDLMFAARSLPDRRFDSRIVRAVSMIGDPRELVDLAATIDEARFDPIIIDAIMRFGEADVIKWAALSIPPVRFTPELAVRFRAAVNSSNYWAIN